MKKKTIILVPDFLVTLVGRKKVAWDGRSVFSGRISRNKNRKKKTITLIKVIRKKKRKKKEKSVYNFYTAPSSVHDEPYNTLLCSFIYG